MMVPRVAMAVVLVALVGLFAPAAAAAPGPGMAVDLPLRPLNDPPIADLLAYTNAATVTCEGETCAVRTTQRYQVALRAGVAPATLRVGLPARLGDHVTRLDDVALHDDQGGALPVGAAAPDAELHAVWEVPLEPGQRRTLVLTYSHPTAAEPLTIWSWEGGALPAWGVVPAVHVELALPEATADDALVRVAPHRANLDGARLWWDYERAGDYAPHYVVAISPPAWERLRTWRARGAHREVAAMLRDLHVAAGDEGVPGLDLMPEVIAELVAALEVDPTDAAARAALVEAYRARADELPARRLNYLLLAARELETALAQEGSGADAPRLATELGRTYLAAADTASAQGDPAGALNYLRLARAVAGAPLAAELAQSDELILRWSVTLAEQGRVVEALAALEGALTPALEDNLLRYAPLLTAARTEVVLDAAHRTVRYEMAPYPLAAGRARERLDAIVQRLEAVSCCRSAVAEEGATLVLTIDTPGAAPAELAACGSSIQDALAADQDLIGALVALPWRGGPTELAREAGLMRDRLRYSERVDTTPLRAVWQAESEYAAWRLVELNNTAPADARAQLERELALAVMREQRQTWEALPPATHWVYTVRVSDATRADGEWLIAWAQDRSLALDLAFPRWHAIRSAALVAAGLLAAPLLVRRLLRLRRRSARES